MINFVLKLQAAMTIKVREPPSVKFNPLRTIIAFLFLSLKKEKKKRLKGISFRSKAVSDTKLI